MLSGKGFGRLAGVVVCILIFATVCIARNFPEYPAREVSQCTVSDEKAGFRIGLLLVDAPKEQETYFGTKMAEKGLVPVYVVMQNGRKEGSFIFQKGGASISGPRVRSTSGEVMSIVGIGGALGIIGLFKVAHAAEVEENLAKKEIQSKTISPGSEARGFLYIKIPKDSPREKIHISFAVTDMTTSQTVTFEFTL